MWCKAGSADRGGFGALLDHLVGKRKQPVRNFQAERLSGPEIDQELELCRQHNRQVTGLSPLMMRPA